MIIVDDLLFVSSCIVVLFCLFLVDFNDDFSRNEPHVVAVKSSLKSSYLRLYEVLRVFHVEFAWLF